MGDLRRQRQLSPRRTHGFCSPLHRSRHTATPHARARMRPPRPCRGPPEDAAGRPKTPLGACGQRTRRGSRAEPRLPVRDPARWAKLLPPDGRELGGRSARPPLRGLQEGRQRLLGEGSRKRVETKPRQGFAQRQRLLCLARLTSGIISPPKPHTGSIPLVSPSLYAQLSRQELGVKLWFC